MRVPAIPCLAILLCVTTHSFANASIRHLSSRLVAGGNSEYIPRDFYVVPTKLVAAGANGELFLIASADNFISFGNGPVGPGIIAAKLDASGTGVWSRVVNVASHTRIFGIAATGDGGMAITGSFRGTIDLGGGPLTSVQASGDVFVAKFDATGAVAWQHGYGDRFEQFAYAVDVAGNGDILVTGSNQGTVDFGGGPIASNGAVDMFVVRLDTDGDLVWSRGFGQTGSQEGQCVTVGEDGHIALAGRMNGGGIDFGGGLLTAVRDDDIVLAVLDSEGGHVWSRLAGSQNFEQAMDVAFDAAGNLFTCGVFRRSLELGGESLIAASTALQTGFVASYDPGGGHRWSYMLADTLRSDARAVGTDTEGNCFVLATKTTEVEIAGQVVPPAGFLLVAFDPAGNPICASGFSNVPVGAQFSVFMAVASDVIHIAVSTNQPINFGGGMLSPDAYDICLAQLALRRAPRVTIADFGAHWTGTDVEVRWNLESAEPLGDYLLTRRIDNSANAEVIDAAAAHDGERVFIDHNTRPGHIHTYALTVETALGDLVSPGATSVSVPAIANELAQNAPNPFNPLTTIRYSLSAPADVSIVIWDVTGAVIARLDQGMQPAGNHEATWGGHNAHGNFVGSGVYFYRLEGVPGTGVRKMVLLK